MHSHHIRFVSLQEDNAPSCDKPHPVVECDSGNAQRPAAAAPVVRRSSRPHKVTALAQESAEQAASHQQPRKGRQATVDKVGLVLNKQLAEASMHMCTAWPHATLRQTHL